MLTNVLAEKNSYSADDYIHLAAHLEDLQRAQCHRALYMARYDYAAALRIMAARPNDADSVVALTGVALYDYSGWFRPCSYHPESAH